jgi:hypothetical protein
MILIGSPANESKTSNWRPHRAQTSDRLAALPPLNEPYAAFDRFRDSQDLRRHDELFDNGSNSAVISGHLQGQPDFGKKPDPVLSACLERRSDSNSPTALSCCREKR